MKKKSFFALISLLFGLYIILTDTGEVSAHCDSYDGPVIKDAQLALDLKDVTPVLKWVAPKDEAVIKALFAQTVAVRDQGKDIRKIADVYFFESPVGITWRTSQPSMNQDR